MRSQFLEESFAGLVMFNFTFKFMRFRFVKFNFKFNLILC